MIKHLIKQKKARAQYHSLNMHFLVFAGMCVGVDSKARVGKMECFIKKYKEYFIHTTLQLTKRAIFIKATISGTHSNTKHQFRFPQKKLMTIKTKQKRTF
jgi:hypothetical protein